MILEDEHLSALAELILHGYPFTKAEGQEELQPYYSFRDEMAFIYGTAITRKRIIVPALLQDMVLKHLHIYHMEIEKTRILVHELIYLVNLNSSIGQTIKISLHVPISKPPDLKINLCHMKFKEGCEGLLKQTSFSINKKHHFCILHYHSKFPVIKQVENFSTENKIKI